MNFLARFVFTATMFLASRSAFTSETTYVYDAHPTLSGVIRSEAFSDEGRVERGLIFYLDQAISVVPGPKADELLDEPERHIKKLQLVIFSDRGFDQVVKGKKVKITGTFMHAHTGHHHTDVLMEVDRIEVAK